jgi:hypothetical protein
MITIYSGAQSPELLSVIITPGASNLNLTTVTGVELHLRDTQTNATKTWTATIDTGTRSSSQLTATYPFQLGDVPSAAVYRVMAYLTLGTSGTRRCVPFNLQVLE